MALDLRNAPKLIGEEGLSTEEDHLETKQLGPKVHDEILGAKLRYEQFDDAHHKILSVQDVYLGSPSQQADLQPFKDFILGTK